MSAPWPQTTGFTANTLSNPYHRLMNTSGNTFRDHAGSMVSTPSPSPLAVKELPHLGGTHAAQRRRRLIASPSSPPPGCLLQDLCNAALQFASDTLRPGGHFVCKFYQGAEDKKLERQLKGLFAKVYREKPESSRSVRPSPSRRRNQRRALALLTRPRRKARRPFLSPCGGNTALAST